jgi:hypothetical protein
LAFNDTVGSNRAHQNVLFLAHRQFDDRICCDIACADDALFIGNRNIIDAHGTALDMTAGFAIGGGKACTHKQ